MTPPKPKNDLPLSRNIRRLRLERDWSQDELAQRSGLSSVKQIEGGKNVGRVETLMSIARAFDVTVGELFVDPDEPMPEALERFLASPSAQDVTAEEKTYLLSARARDKQLTEATYYVLLQAWREMPDKKSVG